MVFHFAILISCLNFRVFVNFSKIPRRIWKISFNMFSLTYILSKNHSRSLLNFFLIGNPTLNCVYGTLEKMIKNPHHSRTSGEVCITDAFPIVALPLTLRFLSLYGYPPLSPLNLQTATSLIFWKWWSFQNQQGPFDLVKWMFSRGCGRT